MADPEIPSHSPGWVAYPVAKLPAGQHLESFKILAPDRVTVVVEGATRFSSEGLDRNTLVVYAVEHEFTSAGTYWVRVCLGGKLVVGYPFRVRSADETP